MAVIGLKTRTTGDKCQTKCEEKPAMDAKWLLMPRDESACSGTSAILAQPAEDCTADPAALSAGRGGETLSEACLLQP